jgi:hypothetical protein
MLPCLVPEAYYVIAGGRTLGSKSYVFVLRLYQVVVVVVLIYVQRVQ